MSKEAHSSGDFLVSASDLMASLVFVFVIVAVLFAFRARLAEEEAQKAKTRADAEGALLREANEAVVGAAAARKELLKQLEGKLSARFKVEISDDGIRFPADLFFDKADHRLKPAGREALRALAHELGELLPCFVPAKSNPAVTCAVKQNYPRGLDALLVEGHTDAQRFVFRDGDQEVDKNWELSAKRALEAFHVLEPELGKFQNLRGERLLGVAGYGSSRPTDPNDPLPDRPRDRRIEIRLLMAAPRVEEVLHGVP